MQGLFEIIGISSDATKKSSFVITFFQKIFVQIINKVKRKNVKKSDASVT